MERFQWLLDGVIRQFKNIEEALSRALANLPFIGDVASNYSNFIALILVILITVFVIKPLVKWSLGVVIIGTSLAAIISYFSGMTFWGVLPLTALGASIVMFSNKFTMG
ncbi:MAG: hypothetical protein GY839_16155 [candidate division Zixibacteria bacterium]|nr:hypothetical protein [candidate division Zixibacteria bacterium]